jgi:hypothetical protein
MSVKTPVPVHNNPLALQIIPKVFFKSGRGEEYQETLY